MYDVYVDLDGVLADFNNGVKKVTGKYPNQLKLGYMWKRLAAVNDFYANLDWMFDGRDLWNYVKRHNPSILTGIPRGNWAPGQKKRWCGENLGFDVPVITLFASDKHLHSGPNHVLIDDRIKTKDSWENAGGIFVHHTSTATTIPMLKKMGL